MAHITLSGVLLDPTGEFSVGDRVRFTHRTSTGDTVKTAQSMLTIPPDGSYNIDLEYGEVLVEYSDYRKPDFKNVGVVIVNQDSTATSIPELLNAVVPPTDAQLLEFQSILGDTTEQAQIATDAALRAEGASSGGQSANIVFLTYALLDAYTPANEAEERGSYKVTNDTDTSKNGYYHWVSGTTYEKDGDLINGVIEAGNVDAVSGGTVFNENQRLNIKPTQLDLEALAVKANKPTAIVEYNHKQAIKADIATNFSIETELYPIADLGLIPGDTVHFGCNILNRSGNIYLETHSLNGLISQTSKTGLLGFGVISNIVTTETLYIKVIILIYPSIEDFAYITTPVLSKQAPNINTIGSYLDQKYKVIEAVNNIAKLEADVSAINAGVATASNIITIGGMNNISDWSTGTAGVNGLDVSGTGTILSSSSGFPFTIDDSLSFIFHAFNNSQNSCVVNLSFYNGQYIYPSKPMVLQPGENIVSFTLDQISPFVTGSGKLYLNTSDTVNISIVGMVGVLSSELNNSTLKALYEAQGFSLVYTAFKFAENATTKLEASVFEDYQIEVDSKLNPTVKTIYAYATTASQADDPLNGKFAGEINNVNAIQRAIDSVPYGSVDIYQIRCIGEFIATTFEQMSTPDAWTGEYRCMVDLSKKNNIQLIGAGEGDTVIFADLPATGAPLNYKFYQTVTVENKNCTIENMIIKGRNLRYPVHTEANGTGVSIDDSTLNYKNVHFWHLGNSGDALIDWPSISSYGIGFGRRMIFNAIGCRFTSKDTSGFAGHDGYTTEKCEVNLTSCVFDASASNTPEKALNFSMFGNENSIFRFNLVGNNFNNGEIYLGDRGQGGLGAYARVSGHGNTVTRFSQQSEHGYYPEMSDVNINAYNDTGGTINQYTPLDYNHQVATGEVYAIALEASSQGEKYIAIRNASLLLSLFTIKAGETISGGDYVLSDNGELIYSTTKTSTRCLSINGTLYLVVD